MAKQLPTEDGLDKPSRKRLEKLGTQWSEPCEAWSVDKLTLPDLKLLLERFTPLQDLIRALVATPEGTSPNTLAQETASLRHEASSAQAAQSSAEDALAEAQAQLAQAHAQCSALQNDLNQHKHDLSECAATTKNLLQENQAQANTIQKLEKEVQQAEKKLKACQAELARSGNAPAELALLRQDNALAQALGLAPLPSDDTLALIQMVAVLAQRDNLERLWRTLKDRCETELRPASASEAALLTAALAWYNHNWRTRPYSLIEATPATAYDMERHQRCRHSPTGDTVAAQHLPGMADGSGTPLCKALVSTR